MLEATDISFAYVNGADVLIDVSIILNRGEIVLLTGPTGSGKSTLAKCLAGFIPHTIQGSFSGHVTLDGEHLDSMRLNDISRKVALVQQDPEGQLCTLRVSDEVAFGPENFLIPEHELAQRVTNSLEAVERPNLVGRATYQLSGGEKQRVAIASMLASEPEYLILDEPTSSLDPAGTDKIRNVISSLKAQGMGIICIEHRFERLRSVADRVLNLSEKGIQELSTIPKISYPLMRTPNEQRNPNPLIQADSLVFCYGARRAIDEVTVEINRGEVVALMGDNGSGKTTLLLLLAGLLSPSSGSVFLESRAIESIPKIAVARKTAVVFQNPNHQIFETTVWKEQALGVDLFELEEDAIERANEYLELAELEAVRNRNPFSLSYGQKRRLNISSLMTHEPELLLFDEPFIGQDHEGRKFVQSMIVSTIDRGGSALIVTHDSEFATQFCDRLVFMDHGHILLDGEPSKVMSQLDELGRDEYLNGRSDTQNGL